MRPLILVVDDEESILWLLRELLELESFDSSPADSGLKALELVCEHTFDLILLDCMMPPGIDGFKTAQIMRFELRVSTPIIMLTAAVGEWRRLAAAELTINDYLQKPFTSQELLRAVRHFL